MLRPFAEAFNNVKLKTKIILIVLLAVVITAGTAIGSLAFVASRYNTMLYSALADSLSMYIRDIEAGLDSVSDASAFIAADGSIQNNLMLINSDTPEYDAYLARSGIYASLQRYIGQNRYLRAMSVFPAGEGQYGVSTNLAGLSLEDHLQAAHEAKASEQPLNWGHKDGRVLFARTIRQLQGMSLRELGVLVIDIDLERIIADSRFSAGVTASQSMAIEESGELIYTSADFSGWNGDAGDSPYIISDIGGIRQFIVRRPAGSLGWVYLSGVPYGDVFRSIQATLWFYIAAVAAAVAISILIATNIARKLTLHFDRLGKKMRSFSNGNLRPIELDYDYSRRKDELGEAHRHFDAMLSDIADLIEDNYVKQLLIKDARLKSLEQQINPHFLYNTLNSIHWQARAANQPQIAGMVKSLSKLLQASLSEAGDTVPLCRELKLIESYIEIQRIRYEERLAYSTAIDDSLAEIEVPKMSIQPLVENAIKYALEMSSETCTVTVSARESGGNAVISVENSSSEIDEDIMRKLNSGERISEGHGIGLMNIDARIKLLFGESYGLGVENGLEGVIISMRLPLPQKAAEGALA